MRKKRTFAQQQDISRSRRGVPKVSPRRSGAVTSASNGSSVSVEHLLKVAGAFNSTLDRCLDDPGVEAVHRVRTGSRRVQAILESIVRQARSSGKTLKMPATAWLRQLKNIRRAAGLVRDLDVHRKLLEKGLQPSTGNSPTGNQAMQTAVETPAPESAVIVAESDSQSDPRQRQIARQVGELDAWLKEQRHVRAGNLLKQIKKRKEKLALRRTDFLAAVEQVPGRAWKTSRHPALVALEDFVRVVDATPSLDATNLHGFRKLTKKARYVAEMGGKERNARMVAKALKQVQDAIGDWHDWQCLSEEAKAVLKEDGLELTAWLEGQADRFLAEALETTEQMSGKMLGEWTWLRRNGLPAKTAPRKPPSRAAEADSGSKPRAITPDAA
jgi:CHAD domain-containing protein